LVEFEEFGLFRPRGQHLRLIVQKFAAMKSWVHGLVPLTFQVIEFFTLLLRKKLLKLGSFRHVVFSCLLELKLGELCRKRPTSFGNFCSCVAGG